jgi:hypothetical protein
VGYASGVLDIDLTRGFYAEMGARANHIWVGAIRIVLRLLELRRNLSEIYGYGNRRNQNAALFRRLHVEKRRVQNLARRQQLYAYTKRRE